MHTILIRRAGALGDVLMATPVLRRMRQENPGARIIFSTLQGQALVGNPDVDLVTHETPHCDRYVNLDMVYESNPKMHATEAYMRAAFGDPGDPSEYVPVFAPEPVMAG